MGTSPPPGAPPLRLASALRQEQKRLTWLFKRHGIEPGDAYYLLLKVISQVGEATWADHSDAAELLVREARSLVKTWKRSCR